MGGLLTRVLQGRFGRAHLFDTRRPVVEHAHPQAHVLLKAGGADGHYVVAGAPCPFRDDMAVLVNPWVPHHNPRPLDGPVTRVLALYIERVWLGGSGTVFAAASVPLDDELRELRDRLAARMAEGDLEAAEAEALLTAVMRALLARHGAGRLPEGSRSVDRRIRRAVAAIRAAGGRPVDLGAIAAAAGLSRSRFFELFRACTGVSPGVYAASLRTEAAIAAIAGSDRSLAAISEELGFPAPAHFTRFLRQQTSLTPSMVRRTAIG